MNKLPALLTQIPGTLGPCATILFLSLLLMSSSYVSRALADRILVADGVARSAIVLDENPSPFAQQAADELRYHIRRASGAELPVINPAQASRLASDTVRIVIGPGPMATRLGVDAAALEPEQYCIKTVGNSVVFAGHDVGSLDAATGSTVTASPATLWAVCHFLDRNLGVRWLWPGELGTYVPAHKTISVPDLDVTVRPDLEQRRLRSGAGGEEALMWHYHHMMGRRTSYGFGHSFGKWWDAYRDQHPDYFAVPPEGQKQPYPLPERVKLCVSNPAVADRIIAEWEAAGAPDNWNVCPNDGSGFCTCARCRALDGIPGQSPEDIWRGNNVNLTGRYVALWNSLLRRMKRKNPNATLSSYAYSAYRDAPEGLKLEDGIVLGIVHSYTAYDQWQRWHDAGAKLFLRPNWWHMGGCAPHIPLHKAGEYFRFAREHSMIGFDFDSLMGYWGTQGPYYYLIARLSARPDLTVDEAIAEYTSAFGGAAPQIRSYLDYWEAFTERAAYTVPAGGSVSQNPDGPYETVCREHNLSNSALSGGWRVMPYLLTDEVLARAESILDAADKSAGEDGTVRARIQFLRDGLKHLRLTRDSIALAYAAQLPAGMTKTDVARQLRDLHRFRDELTPRHVVWGTGVNSTMRTRGIKPETEADALLNMEGL